MKSKKKEARVSLKTYHVYVFCENKAGEKEKVKLILTGDNILDVMLQAEDALKNHKLNAVSGYRYDCVQNWYFN